MTALNGNGYVRPVHALSFDVEEHFQVSAFWSQARRRQWDSLESRVERNTRKIADRLAVSGMKATFFILGWVAERHPELVRHLAAAGHEVASHGYGHELVSAQSPVAFREDVKRAKTILEDLSGRRVLGYRAPSFSITLETAWALPILAEEGYLYDSSVYHKFRDRYGSPQSAGSCYRVETASGPIWEVPPSTLKSCGVHVPVAGGGYFRLFPYLITRLLLKKMEREGARLVMYLHPWEIDPDQPRMQGPLLSRMRHYMNLKRTEQRMCRLLDEFSFSSIAEVMDPIREVYGRQTTGEMRSPADEQQPNRWLESATGGMKRGACLR